MSPDEFLKGSLVSFGTGSHQKLIGGLLIINHINTWVPDGETRSLFCTEENIFHEWRREI